MSYKHVFTMLDNKLIKWTTFDKNELYKYIILAKMK